LPNEIHPIGMPVHDSYNSSTLTALQKCLDKYISFRSRHLKEKPGNGGPISSLFNEFKSNPNFVWSFSTQLSCEICKYTFERNYDSSPLNEISWNSLFTCNGSSTEVIKGTLRDYLGQCPQDYYPTIIYKKINNAARYYCCCFDYAEDLQKGSLEKQVLNKIIIEENFDYENYTFDLVSIIYFQQMHYTTHIKGVYHPKFYPIRDPRWFYHDGMKIGENNGSLTKGILFENSPNWEFDLSSDDELKPYILIYRVTCHVSN